MHLGADFQWESLCGSSVTQLCPTLCDPMDCSLPGFPVLHHLPELAQTHVHWVGDAIQPSSPLLSLSPPACSIQVFGELHEAHSHYGGQSALIHLNVNLTQNIHANTQNNVWAPNAWALTPWTNQVDM